MNKNKKKIGMKQANKKNQKLKMMTNFKKLNKINLPERIVVKQLK